MKEPAQNLRILTDLNTGNFDPQEWNHLAQDSIPLMKWEWYAALEANAHNLSHQGFRPAHLAIYRDEKCLAIAPLYWKRGTVMECTLAGPLSEIAPKRLKAYPERLVGMIPFCSTRGYRFLVDSKEDGPLLISLILKTLKELVAYNKTLVELHHLDLSQREWISSLEKDEWMVEKAFTYRWENRSYKDFDDFVEKLPYKRRRKVRREVALGKREGLNFSLLKGDEITGEWMGRMMECYQRNTQKHWGHQGYLPREFWAFLQSHFRSHLVLVVARQGREVVGMTLMAESDEALFIRWWGALKEIPFLHFNGGYYIPIGYAIENKKKYIDGGYQEINRSWRGFEVVEDWSFCYTSDPLLKEYLSDSLKSGWKPDLP